MTKVNKTHGFKSIAQFYHKEKKKMEELKDQSSITLQCKHSFNKYDLIDKFKWRTAGTILTSSTDEGGKKYFKCLDCYHLI